ncbi:hypothetical protein HH214_16275 [Mucilaginibacter robiniae]|uniref:Uncharacterized protein n=1 Tax=Mucilaginibacter robiniae TaxID=2728022 RepID=A0A7L5E8V8_9SPHI|nr:hypothetical protein [Mucilaginibacter robiniae]QJD97313.1 hypothetical protein HH214_16275 [Mucilaginibacter robiniae]
MTTNWYINKQGQFAYDPLVPVMVLYNNECVASLTSYSGGASKTYNWDDFRIPESDSLDTGAGEFYVSDNTPKNGW